MRGTPAGVGPLAQPADRVGSRGSATLEFALVLPIVLVMALAIVQIGVLVKDQLVVIESARAGAREASVNADDDAARQAAEGAASSLDPASLDVAVDRSGGSGSPVSVAVTYHAPIAIPVVAWLFPSAVQLSATATMRQETG